MFGMMWATRRANLIAVLLYMLTSWQTRAFAPARLSPRRFGSNIVSLRATASNPARGRPPAEFELQEIKIQLQEMVENRIASRDLDTNKRRELSWYVRRIIELRPSPVDLKKLCHKLPHTKWRLAFSTEYATLGALPRDATVFLNFIDDLRMDYQLEYSNRTLGLKKLSAHSYYQCSVSPTEPGLVSFVYDKVTTDAFGFANIGVGFFGLLKGRANYVESAWYDGEYWMERSFTPTGEEFFNVYVRVNDSKQ